MRTRSHRAIVAAAVIFVLAAPLTGARAQSAASLPRIGVVGPRTPADGAYYLDPFRQGLKELGWEEGKNVVMEYRWADGRLERVPSLVAELVRLKVDVIFAGSTAVTVAAKDLTTTIPIVMATGGDPVEVGLVASLARPGGNITGVAYSVGSGTFVKQLELLKEAVPQLRRVAVLHNADNRGGVVAVKHLGEVAGSMGIRLLTVEARRPEDFDRAFATMSRERAQALLVVTDSLFGFHRQRIQDLVAKNRLPAIYGLREHVQIGGLISYSTDLRENYRRAATYVDRILKGSKPGDLPVEQPTKFELVINLKTAKALGLTIPPSLLARADQVIE